MWFRVRFRTAIRTLAVRGSYGFGPWFVRFRSVVLTVSVRFRSVVRAARYGFVPWFVRLGTVSFRGSEDFGAFWFRDLCNYGAVSVRLIFVVRMM